MAEALSDPGEWYLDRPSGRLTYLPLPGEDLTSVEIVAPRLESLLCLEGVAHLRFEGLTFAHSEWQAPSTYADSVQAAFDVAGAVIVRHADDCTFHSCRIEHVSSYGVELKDGTIDTTFDHCELRDLGAGGIKIWHGCRRNAVVDCEIADGGHVWAAGVGVLIGRATGNRIEHNHIHDFWYTGISAGWNWGYAESDSYGNLIEWNHIHDIGKGLLSDMGGIYLLGPAAGTRLRYNLIHDITCRRYGGWCIYTDEGSTDVLIEGNVCFNSNDTVFNQHYGRNNQIRGNIFAYGGKAVLSYGKPEPHLGMVLESNILLARGTPIVRDTAPERWMLAQGGFQRNLYWCDDGPVSFERRGPRTFGSQPFPASFRAEAPRYLALGNLPVVSGKLSDADWQRATSWTRFHDQHGTTEAAHGSGELRFLRHDGDLLVQARCRRPKLYELSETVTGALWIREHVELFLRPCADRSGVVQIGVAADGECAAVWHDCSAPARFEWVGEVTTTADSWIATMRLPLEPILAAVSGGSSGATSVAEWGFLLGFTTAIESADWPTWQAQGHDAAGAVGDPGFIDPVHGDFRLRPDSPALELGFISVDMRKAGVRPLTKEARP